MTAWYSVLHLLVDGACALAMFGSFLQEGGGYPSILVYNFCAFALQMPLGVVLDALEERRETGQKDYAFWFVGLGIVCTALGGFLHPAVLGTGNALFHVGGGVGTIREDKGKGWGGRGLGIFVAPGALGLYLGTLAGKGGAWQVCFLGVSALMALLYAVAFCQKRYGGKWHDREQYGREQYGREKYGGKWHGRERYGKEGYGGKWRHRKQKVLVTAACCLLVVILRSYVGMAVAFPWKSGILAGGLAVLALAGGKVAGGFAAAKCGLRRTVLVSLSLAACCYFFSGSMLVGLAALFFFNMTMPVTLYGMARSMPGKEGSAFGFLTFALFLGFLPVYFGKVPAVGGNVMGCVGSIVSLLLLAAGIREGGQAKKGGSGQCARGEGGSNL